MSVQQQHSVFTLLSFIWLLSFCFFAEQDCLAISGNTFISQPVRPVAAKQLKAGAQINTEQHKVYETRKDHRKKLSAMADSAMGGTTPWSNAFNFKKAWGTQVDPRTGLLSAFIKAGSLISNFGHGPDINLVLNYSSGSTANPDGIAVSWRWNITHFNRTTNQLTTSGGQVFNLAQTHNGRWQPLYHKLKDIMIQGDKVHGFTITYANGLREILNKEGYETRLEQQDGWGVNFLYTQGKNLLYAIEDDQQHKINITFSNGYFVVTSYGTQGQPVNVSINNANARLSDISLPLADRKTEAGIHIYYEGNRIIQTNYPTGLKKYFYYNCQNAIKFSTINGAQNKALCAVSREDTMTGDQNKMSEIRYQYTEANANEHDYLGFNSGLTAMNGSTKDLLFEAPDDYTYCTTEDNGLVKERRTYNKYHLLIDDQKVSDNTDKILSEVQNFYCRSDQLDGCSHSSFKDLPTTYSLPLKTVTKLWGDNEGKPDTSQITRNYNDYGQVTSRSDSYGRVTKTTYCPAAGDAACPAQPEGWHLSALPESVVVYPAKTDAKIALSPVFTYNFYRKMYNHTGEGYLQKLDHQVQRSGDTKTVITRNYYDDRNNIFTYGLIKQTILTGNSPGTLTSVIKDYRYTQSADGHSRTIHSSIELGGGKRQPLPSETISLFTNQLIQRTDASGRNMTQYHYDLWGRLIQTDRAAGTPFATHVSYHYLLSPSVNNVVITNDNGLKRKVVMDSAGRQIMDFAEEISADGKAESEHWLLKHKTTYDSYGRIVAKYQYLVDSSNSVHALKTTYDYNETGDVTHVHLPDGETETKLYDDPLRCTVSYHRDREGKYSPVSIVIANTLSKPVKQIILPAVHAGLPSVATLCSKRTPPDAKISTTTYDGFGRIIRVTDAMGKVTSKSYNALGQISEVTDPFGDKLQYMYDLIGKVIQQWSLPVRGGRYLLSSAEYNAAGLLLWKAGEDSKRTTYTYTIDSKPATITTPSGNIISWSYNILGLPVNKYANGKLLLQTTYDRATTLPIKKEDATGVTRWTYRDDDLPQQMVHFGNNNYPDYRLQWQYDKNQRVISTTDIHGNKTFIGYDALGRIITSYYQNKLLSDLVYDGFSRVASIHYGSGMQRTISYDDFGHQSQVTDVLNGHLLFRWHYTYDQNNNIVQVAQQAQNNEQGMLRYHYDLLNNLVSVTCDGSSGLPLCPRDTDFTGSGLKNAPIITRQDYLFTPLNRISQVKEVLHNSENNKILTKVMRYDYSNIKAPLRLQKISTQWNENRPVNNLLSYDSSGNMVLDGGGNQITYNMFNQISRVVKPDGTQSLYVYDGSNKEVAEKTTNSIHHLFYRGKTLINESINTFGQTTHTIGFCGVARTTDGMIDHYYEHNYKGDVTAVLVSDPNHAGRYQLNYYNIYSPYGMSWHQSALFLSLSGYQKPLAGFDGERTDPATGWQFLGAGHRTYSPIQRCFVSEDPMGDGYRFTSNNPVMNTDPTGNMPKWLGKMMTGLNDITTFGLAAVHKRWANITASVVLAGLSIFGIACAVASYGGTLAVAAAAASMGALNSVPIVAAAIPSNKGLNIAATISGGVSMVIAVTTMPFAVEGFSDILNNSRSVLGGALLQSNPELNIRGSIFSLFTKNYLKIGNNGGQLKSVIEALKVAEPNADRSVHTLMLAAMMSGKTINLRKVEEYIETMAQINERYLDLIESSLQVERNEIIAKATLFSQITTDITTRPGHITLDSMEREGVNSTMIIVENKKNSGVVISQGSHLELVQVDNYYLDVSNSRVLYDRIGYDVAAFI